MKKFYNSKIISITILVIYMLLIFFFSNMDSKESNNVSYKITDKIIDVVENDELVIKDKVETRDNLNYVVRKTAHFTEYTILGILVLNVFSFYSLENRKKIIYSLIFCFVYAVSDEVHQMFISGRTPLATDVLIDSLGSLSGIILYLKLLPNKLKCKIHVK